MTIVDPDKGQLIAMVPIDGRVDSVAFDPVLQFVFACNGVGTLTVTSEHSADQFVVLENMRTKRHTRSMALDTTSHKLYLCYRRFPTSTD